MPNNIDFIILDWLQLRGGMWFTAAAIAQSPAIEQAHPGQYRDRKRAVQAALARMEGSGFISRRAGADGKPEYGVEY